MRREVSTARYYAEVRREFAYGELSHKTVNLPSSNKLKYLVIFKDKRMPGWEVTEELFYELDLPFKPETLTPSDFDYEKENEAKRSKYVTDINITINKNLLKAAKKKLAENNQSLDSFIIQALELYLLKDDNYF